MSYKQIAPLATAGINSSASINYSPVSGKVITLVSGTDFIGYTGENTALGVNAGNIASVSGDYNTLVGYEAGKVITTAAGNVMVGRQAGKAHTTGNDNIYLGYVNSPNKTSGTGNTCLGSQSGASISGNYNTIVGFQCGNYPTNESNNILLANIGTPGDNHVMRLGETGVGTRQVSTTYIAGVYGVTTTSATTSPVLISDGEQLGTIASSARFKKDIADMGDSSSAMMQLRPVTFKYKAHTDDVMQFGLIAEEAQQVMPGIVNLDQEGNPFTVRYHDMIPMLLNELQKLAARVAELEAKV